LEQLHIDTKKEYKMKVLKTISAGQQGSQKYLQVWGDKLLNVRYREDNTGEIVITTVEIVVDERPKPRQGCQQRGYLAARAKSYVAIKIGFDEASLRVKVKQSGGQWNNDRELWILSREKVMALGLKERIAPESIK
jgi:hypothetical protein